MLYFISKITKKSLHYLCGESYLFIKQEYYYNIHVAPSTKGVNMLYKALDALKMLSTPKLCKFIVTCEVLLQKVSQETIFEVIIEY